MDYYFREWLFGIIEDDPIPQEIKYLTFIISVYPDRCELAVTGSEEKLEICQPNFYYPLEAQCFYNTAYFNLRPLGRKVILDKTKSLIQRCFQALTSGNITLVSSNGRSDLLNKAISVGFRGKKATFLVKT